MSLFSNLKVSHSVAIVGILPTLFAIIAVAFLVKSLNERVYEGRIAEDMVKLSTILDGVAHNFAVERGLTAGFLGSNGAKGKEALLSQRKVADDAEATLKNIEANAFDRLSLEQLNRLRAPVLNMLKGKSQVRQKVDALAADNGSFDFYSEVNRQALNAIQQVILDISNRDIAKALEARLSLLWMKERAGQYRGALNGVFAAQTTTLKRQSQIAAFIEDEHHQLEHFMVSASDQEEALLNNVMQNEKWKAVDKTTQAFLAMKDVSSVAGPADWFGLATAKIGLIKGVADKISVEINTLSAALTSRSELYRNGLIIGFIVLISPVIWLAFSLTRSLSKRVERISQALSNVSADRNLVGRIENTSKDELGEIIKNLNIHLDHLSESFHLMVDMASESKESMSVLSDYSKSALQETKDQFSQTDLMASAVEEMSLTSNTISQDMLSSAEATESIREQSTQGSERMQTILQSIANLSTEVEGGHKAVQSVTGHTEEISSILQTIESIAEQTNLLALNAAIEAARAGEQGRGFAVVADEVRTLAQRTQNSTEEIRSMIEALVGSGKSALQSMGQCASMATETSHVVSENVAMMQGLFDAIEQLTQTIERVATASEEQSQVSEEINSNIQNISGRSERILDLVNKTDEGAIQAQQRFESVLREISSYKLS